MTDMYMHMQVVGYTVINTSIIYIASDTNYFWPRKYQYMHHIALKMEMEHPLNVRVN